MIDLRVVVKFCRDYKITFDEFMLLYLLHLYNIEEETGVRTFPKFLSKSNSVNDVTLHYTNEVKTFDRSTISNLEKNELIRYTQIGKDFSLENIKFTNKAKNIFDYQFIHFEEFYKLYPAFIDNFNDASQAKISLKATNKLEVKAEFDKRFLKISYDDDDTLSYYDRFMKVTAWAKRNGYLKMNILNWLTSDAWLDLEEHMSDSVPPGTVML
jgi:hypothetical protein